MKMYYKKRKSIMIPKIRKIKEGDPLGLGALGGTWVVIAKHRWTDYDVCYSFGEAFRYWLWHCGVNPKIAFGWFNNKIKKEEDEQNTKA